MKNTATFLAVVITAILFSVSAWSVEALTKPRVEAAISAVKEGSEAYKDHPVLKMDNQAGGEFFSDGAVKKITARMRKGGIYAGWQKVSTSHGFDSVEQSLEVFRRAMLAFTADQAESTNMDFKSSVTMMEAQVSEMEKRGLPESALAQFKKNLQWMNAMAHAVSTVSPEDKQFAGENQLWLGQQFEHLNMKN